MAQSSCQMVDGWWWQWGSGFVPVSTRRRWPIQAESHSRYAMLEKANSLEPGNASLKRSLQSHIMRATRKEEGNTMADQQHLAVLKQGVAAWNAWRRQHPEIHPDLREAELSEADLRGADLSHSNLIPSTLSHAHLI